MQAFRCDVVAIFACSIAVASSASAYGVQDAGRFAPIPTQSTVESEEVLECLRAGHGPIGIPVMSLSIPRQTAQADLVRWCRLLEVDPSFSSRLKSALERACARDDAFRLNRFPAAFELAASVARPAESMSADQVARLSTDIASTRRRILSDMLALERESMRSALSEDEASAVELEVLDAIGHLRMIELVNDSVATPEVAKVSIGRLLDVHGPRILSEQSLAELGATLLRRDRYTNASGTFDRFHSRFPEMGAESVAYVLIRSGKLYVITFTAKPDRAGPFFGQANQIMSTFTAR